MRLVRWIGDPSPWQDAVMRKNLMLNTLSPAIVERLSFFDKHQRISVVSDHSESILGPAHGFSQTYVFGPQQFAVWMHDQDAAKLFANEWDRWQYLDVTDAPYTERRPPLKGSDWMAIVASFAKVAANRKLLPQYR